MIRVAVFGAAGRMGGTVCAAVAADPALQLVAAVDPAAEGTRIEEVVVAGRPDAVGAAAVDVAVDFTVRDAALANLGWCAAHGVHAVAGTTGLLPPDLEGLAVAFPPDGTLSCVVAPNFAIGAVLMIRFAELAAPWFETAEIIELHHDAKTDAPSGTAMLTASRLAAASAEWGRDPTRLEVLPGARGGVGPGGVHVHAVRLRGLVAHQEVLLGTAGQTLSIRHDSYDRTSFMPGVLLAVKAAATGERPGLTVGLDALLGL